jgi:hypothetical protein
MIDITISFESDEAEAAHWAQAEHSTRVGQHEDKRYAAAQFRSRTADLIVWNAALRTWDTYRLVRQNAALVARVRRLTYRQHAWLDTVSIA